MQYDFTPLGDGKKIHGNAVYEKEKYPEDVTEKDIEIHAAPATRLHLINFLAAIEEGKTPSADIEEGHISTASCILANMAMKTGRTLSYNHLTRQVIGDAEATALLQRAYREPWTHPHPDRV
jgi:hypothetical protein